MSLSLFSKWPQVRRRPTDITAFGLHSKGQSIGGNSDLQTLKSTDKLQTLLA